MGFTSAAQQSLVCRNGLKFSTWFSIPLFHTFLTADIWLFKKDMLLSLVQMPRIVLSKPFIGNDVSFMGPCHYKITIKVSVVSNYISHTCSGLWNASIPRQAGVGFCTSEQSNKSSIPISSCDSWPFSKLNIFLSCTRVCLDLYFQYGFISSFWSVLCYI